MLYVYGLISAAGAAPAAMGIDSQPVKLIELGGLCLAVSHMPAHVEPTPDRLAQHHRVLLSLLEQGSVVPFRFGSVFRDEEELCSRLAPQMEGLAAKLAHVEGCVEVGVKLPVEAPELSPHLSHRRSVATPPDGIGTGTAYLLGKKRLLMVEERAAEQATRLGAELGARDVRHELRDHSMTVALLVERGRQTEVRHRLARYGRVSGPWAPSSFV